jgi:hypothetical protein
VGRVAALCVGCLLVCGVLEYRARVVAADLALDQPIWYAQARERLRHERLDVLVLGSSRVAYAVTEDRVAARLRERLRRPVTVVDLGMGYTTWAEHALGLARLAEAAPDKVRGTLVLLEAPTGRVPLGSWAQYYHPFSPGLLRLVLSPKDLPALWASPEQFDRKVAASLDWLGSSSALWRHRRRLREVAVERLSGRLLREPQGDTPSAGIGGSRAGTRNLTNTKLNLVLQGIGLGLTAPPDQPAPTEALVATARSAGMIPMLVFVPEHPSRMDYGGYGDQRHVPGTSRLGDVPMLAPPVLVSPLDFFDGIHLAPDCAARYSDALADLLARAIGGSGA